MSSKSAALYLRISLDAKRDGLAIQRQRDECVALAERHGLSTTDELTYEDASLSAWDKSVHRPRYEAMLGDYRAGKFGTIVAYNLDRLTRQPAQLEHLIDLAEERGLRILTVTGEADLSTDDGRLFARIKAGVSRAESDRKAERQRVARKQRAELGRRPAGGRRPTGYDREGGVIRAEAAVVQLLFAEAIKGASLNALARALSGKPKVGDPDIPALEKPVIREKREMAERGVVSRGRPDAPAPWPDWSATSVLAILRNPRYAGFAVYSDAKKSSAVRTRARWTDLIVRDKHGEPVVGDWEPIVEPDLWWAVQDVLTNPARQTGRHGGERRHLGSGLFLCGVCDRPLRAAGRADAGRYRCVDEHLSRLRRGLDDYVLRLIATRLAKPGTALKFTRRDAKLAHIDTQLGDLRDRLRRVEQDYDDGVLEGRDLKRNRETIEPKIASLEAERARHVASGPASKILAAADRKAAFLDADLLTQRAVIETLAVVRVLPAERGRREFDTSTVEIEWRTS